MTEGVKTFIQNRAKFPDAELRNYVGNWVAFSADGRKILASSQHLEDLDQHLQQAGVDPEEVYFERIELDESTLGGAELH